MNMKFKLTEQQIKIINEVNKAEGFEEYSPEYDYTSISVLPKSNNPNEIKVVFFNGSNFGKSDYLNPERNVSVYFIGSKGEFEFDSDNIRYSGKSPFIFGDKLKDEYYDKLLPLMKTINVDKPLVTSNGNFPIPNKVEVVSKLNSLRSWLSNSYGLGLKGVINTILEPLKTGIGGSEIEKYKEGVSLLLKHGKISKVSHDNFLKSLRDRKLVYDNDGNWSQVNKLNTNYSDLSELITDLLFDSYEEEGLSSNKILEVIGRGDLNDIKTVLKFYKNKLSNKIIQKYSKSPEKLFSYTKNSIKNSKKGESVEDEVRDRFLSKFDGSQLIYQGGNGDFIDMIFYIDLIIRFKNGKVYTIQVKSNEYQANDFISKSTNNKAVDLVVWPGKNGEFNIKQVKPPHKLHTIGD